MNKKAPAVLIASGLLLTIGIALGFALQGTIASVTKDIVTSTENANKPKFIFDTASFPDWATTGNTWHDITSTESGDPVSSISVSQCIEESNCSNLVEKCRTKADDSNRYCQELERYTSDGCMVQAYYFGSLINPAAARLDRLQQQSSFGSTPQEVGIKTLSMTTPDGGIDYQLYLYDTHNSDDTYRRGSAFGFIPLDNGHIEVRATCWEASELNDTLPALNALRLEA